MVFHEDPRVSPPYLFMFTKPRPRGFLKRTVHALETNFVSYRCDGTCTEETDIKTEPALSRITGSLASGFSIELWASDRSSLRRRALRGSASAYGATFVSGLFVEFKPELSAFAGKMFTAVFGLK
jgi:hypothetical protein